MANKLSGKAAFVTGGSQGIGKAVGEAFLEKGVKVCIADVNVPTGEKTVEELQVKYGKENVMFVKCDVTSEKEFEDSLLTAKRKFGYLDILINNAGILLESSWEKTIDVNMKGVMRGTMLAFKHLSDKNGKQGGTVINNASVLALFTEPLLPAYTSSKFAVGAWTRCWGDEINVKRTNVKVAAICPDPTDTDLIWGVRSNSVESARAEKLVDIAKDNFLQTADIANAFVKILEEDVSGALLHVARKKGTTETVLKYIDNVPFTP